jgi:hypothetical protein
MWRKGRSVRSEIVVQNALVELRKARQHIEAMIGSLVLAAEQQMGEARLHAELHEGIERLVRHYEHGAGKRVVEIVYTPLGSEVRTGRTIRQGRKNAATQRKRAG